MNQDTQTASQPQISISKETMANLPAEQFRGRIILIQDPHTLDKAIAYLRDQNLVGFDTETRPNFKRGDTHKVSLMQISTADTCFLIRLNHTGLTDTLIQWLQDPDLTKIGLSLKDDFHALNKLAPVAPQGFIELQQMVKDYLITDASLTKIYSILFNHRISKAQRLTNWEAPELTRAQMQYAALDAWACLQIYTHLKSGHFLPSSSPYLH